MCAVRNSSRLPGPGWVPGPGVGAWSRGVPGPRRVPGPGGSLVPGRSLVPGGCLVLGGWWYPSMYWGRSPPSVNRMTDRCKIITFATSFWRLKRWRQKQPHRFHALAPPSPHLAAGSTTGFRAIRSLSTRLKIGNETVSLGDATISLHILQL